MQKYSCNEDFFKQDSEEAFYWAGFIAADGCLHLKHGKYSDVKTVQLVCGTDDSEHIEKFRTAVNYTGTTYKRATEKSKKDGHQLWRHHLQISSSGLYSDLERRFDIHPRKTNNHSFPNVLLDHPMLRHFMRGYFDGDGGFYLNTSGDTPQMTIRICGTLDFLKQYKSVLEQGAGVVSKSQPYMHNGQGALNYCGNGLVSKIAKYLYNDSVVYMQRKNEQAQQAVSLVKRNPPSREVVLAAFNKLQKTQAVADALNMSISGVTYLVREYNIQYVYKRGA